MGFLSKIGKGIKSAFKKIGKGIKGAFKSIGKFMDKIGIVGQIGLSLLLPGIGSALSGMWGSVVGGLQAYSGVGASIVNGAGNFLNAATKVASNITKPFTTITEGVKNVVGETLKAGANALGVDTALLKAGETFGSDYLKGLGKSISEANLTSIGKQITGSGEAFLKSFSGGGVDPTGAFEKARLEATTASPAEIASITPPTPQFADPDLATPDMPASMSEVKVTGKMPDSLLSPDVDLTPPAVGDPSAVVNRNLLNQAQTAPDAFDIEFNTGFTPEELSELRSKQYFASTDASTIPTKTISSAPFDFKAEAAQRAKTLQDLGVTSEIQAEAAKEGFIDKTMRLGREKLSELPEKAMDKLGSTITDMPSQFARRAAGLDPDPVYNQTSYATVVPTIQEAPMVGSQGMVDPVQYVANNQQSMSLQPFGFNANMYNEATYINNMRKYGLA